MFTLPKRFEMGRKDLPFYYDDEWITNGSIMIKKTIIKDVFKYCMPTDREQPDLKRVVVEITGSKWKRTNRLYDNGYYARAFENVDSGMEIYFNDDFITHFKVDELNGEAESACITNDGNFIIMPCRVNGDFTNKISTYSNVAVA